jgi:hypothetical protein
VRWTGSLEAPVSGAYGIRIFTIGDGRLIIDGREILTSGAHSTSTGQIDLAAGPHDIEVIFTNDIGSAQIFLFWQPPGSEWTSIPTEYFSLR